MAGVERGSELGELALETAGLIAGKQTLAPAATGDENRCSEAEPARKKCTGCGAHAALTLENGDVCGRLGGHEPSLTGRR